MTSVPQIPTPAQQPEWEAVATSLSQLATAFTWGTFVLGVVAIFGALQWTRLVRLEAREEARTAAEEEIRRIAEPYLDRWLTDNGGPILREWQQLGTPTVSVDLADQIAQNVNSEPEGK